MICLGIDTSAAVAHVAVTGDGRDLASFSTDVGKKHSETLLVAVRETLDKAGESLATVELVAVGLGPGTWTGLRVGITTAQALAYARGVPIIGISTLDAIAAGVTGYAGKLAVVVDARRREVYGKNFTLDGQGGIAADGGIFVTAPDNIDRFVGPECALVGDGAAFLSDKDRARRRILSARFGKVDAGEICRLAVVRYQREGPGNPQDIMPIYVRKSDAEIARGGNKTDTEIIC